MRGVTPWLWFDTEAEEAAVFYTGIFPDAEILETVRYTEAGPGEPGAVMTVRFTLAGREYAGLNGGPHEEFNDAVSFQVLCESQDEVDHYWNRLGEGGREVQCGWLKDRYGVSWQVVPTVLAELVADPDPAKAQATTRAMLAMTKLDVAALRRAHDEA